MAKTAGHEWREVHCKAVDIATGFTSPSRAAELILNEMFRRGPAEVALGPEGPAVVELEPVGIRGMTQRRPVHVERGDLVVISGGARGVTAEVAVALAESFGPRLVLHGRTHAPAPQPDWLAEIHDEPGLKRVPCWNGRKEAGRSRKSVVMHDGSWLNERSAVSSFVSKMRARPLSITRSTCETLPLYVP